ncbi:hypothetical protein P171DRAFT_31112 [Karstenula rhodostoma CBS 690.94]|uniref:Uncharacterized protein n=1 Tax=Karstenula rhodostoma CBS 690.94 TaxID=1392251 RepID=A0A9P4PFX7_9PLEO|nr:hypothetical protein P171DRAFT_31112 [Karstenula rhodostoma CBS 690.94]
MQPNSVHMGFLARFTQESSKTVLINGNVSKQRLLRDGLFVGQLNRERLLGQVEGMLVGQQVLVDGHSLIDSYKLCGMEVPSALLAEVDGGAFDPAQDIAEPSSMSGDGADISSVGRDVNQLDVSNEDVQIKSEGGRADAKEGDFARELSLGSSPLSECPSDLSDWEMNDQINPFDRAQTPKLDLKSESNSPSHESLTDGLERPNKTSSRSDSTDSAIEITATRRSTRIFLIK